MKTIAFATYQGLPSLTADEGAVCEVLQQHGIAATGALWDDPTVPWDRFDAVIVRSCWDYHLRAEEFQVWLDRLERAGLPIWNPAPLLRWNMNKLYLRDLAARGVTIIPTVWLERGAPANLAQVLAQQGWAEAVVKPAVSATAFGTWRTSAATAAVDQTKLAELLARGEVLVQPFMPEICDAGEWSFLFLGGRYSHAVLKRPQAGDFRVQADYGGTVVTVEPPAELIAQATRVVEAVEGRWLYARVDGVVADGQLLLMELEMVEPALFLSHHPAGVNRFAEAIRAVIGAANE